MKDPRLSDDDLDLFVSYAYGGSAYRAGRRAQAQALSNLFRGKPVDGCQDKVGHGTPDQN